MALLNKNGRALLLLWDLDKDILMELEMPFIGLLEEAEVLVKEALQLFEMELIIFMDMMMIKFIELS
jgi:hypothetical protein